MTPIDLSPSDPPFIIFTMPLTLDAWLAKWLQCGHNGMLRAASVESWLAGVREHSSVESSTPISWKLAKQRIPDLRLAVVNRPITGIIEDYALLGKQVRSEALWEHFFILEAICNAPGIGLLHLTPGEDIRPGLRKLWKFLHPSLPFDEDWLDECAEDFTTDPLAGFVLPPSISFGLDVAWQSRLLGGNSSTLWLN